MECTHSNAQIIVKSVMYSEIYQGHNEVSDGDVMPVSYAVSCSNCGLDATYYSSRLPKWLKNVVSNLGKSNEGH